MLLDGVVVVDSDEKIHYCNNAFGSIIKVPVKRIKSDSSLDSYVTFAPKLRNTYGPEGLESVKEPLPYRELNFTSKTGFTGKIMFTAQPLPHALYPKPLWILFIRDVVLESSLQNKYVKELGKKERILEKLQVAHKALKEYSQTLEQKVSQRTRDLAVTNQTLLAMVNSLSQGFVVVDKGGICSATYSRISLRHFEADPSQKSIATLLKIPPKEQETFLNWQRMLVDERLPFEDLVHLGPKTVPHSKGKHIAVEFYPVRNESKAISAIVVVTTDKTEEIKALLEAERERLYAKQVIRLTQDREYFWRFVEEGQEILTKIRDSVDRIFNDREIQETVLRLAHTLKGEAHILSISSLVQDIHDFESTVSEVIGSARASGPTRENLLGEILQKAELSFQRYCREGERILGVKNRFSGKQVEIPFKFLKSFQTKLIPHKNLAHEFEENFLKEPVEKYLNRYNDLIFEIATKCGKEINPLIIRGGNFRILIDEYSHFFDTLVHIITNAVEHGIEPPAVRLTKNKPPAGTISIEISNLSGHLTFTVVDDGNGIDPSKMRKKLESNQKAVGDENDHEVIQHIFDAGFSTSSNVTSISGRGMGLNALKVAVSNHRGKVEVYSELDVGTCFVITFPLNVFEAAS